MLTSVTHQPRLQFSPAAYVAAVAVGLVVGGVPSAYFLLGALGGSIPIPTDAGDWVGIGLRIAAAAFIALPGAMVLFLPGAILSFWLASRLKSGSIWSHAVLGAANAFGSSVLALGAWAMLTSGVGDLSGLLALSIAVATVAIPAGTIAGLTYHAVERRTRIAPRRLHAEPAGGPA
jgi:hypothetical protein